MQASLDRGLAVLERSVDKGFEATGTRLDNVEIQMRTIQERQAFDAARLKALEEFRRTVEQEQARTAESREARLATALDDSQVTKTLRLLGALILGLVTVVGVLAALGVFA